MTPNPQKKPTFAQNVGDLLRLAGPLMFGQLASLGITSTDIYIAGYVRLSILPSLIFPFS